MEDDKRKYRRIRTDCLVKIRRMSQSETTLHKIEKIKDISLGGVFIETKFPLETGSVLEFSFTVPGTSNIITAKGVVKWSNSGRFEGQPLGMGIEFLEVSSRSDKALENYVKDAQSKEIHDIIAKSPQHLTILKYLSGMQNHAISFETLKEFFNLDDARLAAILRVFSEAGIIRIKGDTIQYGPIEDIKVREAVESLLKKTERHEKR